MRRRSFRDDDPQVTRVRDPYLGTETVVKECPECDKEDSE